MRTTELEVEVILGMMNAAVKKDGMDAAADVLVRVLDEVRDAAYQAGERRGRERAAEVARQEGTCGTAVCLHESCMATREVMAAIRDLPDEEPKP